VNRQDLLDRLRASEASLYSPHIQTAFLARSDEDKASFVQMRQSIARLVNDITNQELEALNKALATHDATLQSALLELQGALSDITDSKLTLRRVTTAVQIISGIAGGVGGFFLQ
jgi:hypothetical protein